MTTSADRRPHRRAASLAQLLNKELSADVRRDLAADPFAAIETHFGLIVEERDSPELSENSPVIGTHFEDEGRIVIGQSLSRPRMLFTALHELGHHLINRQRDIYLTIAGPPRKRALEESICDSFAGGILIPSELVDQVIGDGGPTAQAVIDLYRQSNASRAAAAVRVAERLGAVGHVMVADLRGVALFTATVGMDYRVAPNTPQNPGIATRAALSGRATGDDRVTYRSGRTSELFHAQAIRDSEYVFAVYTQGLAAWEDLHILPKDGPSVREAVCPHCDEAFEAWTTHQPCAQPECPACGRCGCGSARGESVTACSSCFRQVPFRRLAGGICDDCR